MSPSTVPRVHSVQEKPLSGTEFRKTTEKRRALTAHVPGTHNLYTRRLSLRGRLPLRNFELHNRGGLGTFTR